jgi:hypothetical protein
MRKLTGLLLALALIAPAWPQAQPKPALPPGPQSTAPPTPVLVQEITTGLVMASVCIVPLRRKVRQFRRVLRPSAVTVAIRSRNTGQGPVRITEE